MPCPRGCGGQLFFVHPREQGLPDDRPGDYECLLCGRGRPESQEEIRARTGRPTSVDKTEAHIIAFRAGNMVSKPRTVADERRYTDENKRRAARV